MAMGDIQLDADGNRVLLDSDAEADPVDGTLWLHDGVRETCCVCLCDDCGCCNQEERKLCSITATIASWVPLDCTCGPTAGCLAGQSCCVNTEPGTDINGTYELEPAGVIGGHGCSYQGGADGVGIARIRESPPEDCLSGDLLAEGTDLAITVECVPPGQHVDMPFGGWRIIAGIVMQSEPGADLTFCAGASAVTFCVTNPACVVGFIANPTEAQEYFCTDNPLVFSATGFCGQTAEITLSFNYYIAGEAPFWWFFGDN